MNKEKQIEEMAKELCCKDTCEIKKIGIPCYRRCKAHIYATRAIDKGYRKASEVAREIFEEIESICSDFPLYGNVNTIILSERDLAFIKKKYTEVKGEV